nr:water-soluble peptide [Papaver somniferum]
NQNGSNPKTVKQA